MIDWTRVDELREEVGEEDFSEIVALFLEETDATLEELRVSTDPDTVEALLHALKGSALNLGFEAMSRLCCAHECGAGGSLPDITGAFDEIVNAFKSSRAELLSRN